MKNAKFFIKCILAILPILAVMIYASLFPYGYMDIEYPSWKYTKDTAKNIAASYNSSMSANSDGPTALFVAGKNEDGSTFTSSDSKSNDYKKALSSTMTVILGDSRAMADLVPSEFDTPAVNLAVGGATSIEMYYTLKEFIKNNGKPDNVIVMFAPFHYSIIDNFWTRTVYFNYLSVQDMMDLYSYAEATGSETLLQKGYKNDLLSYRMRFPDKYLPALLNAKGFGRYSENKAKYSKVSAMFGHDQFGTLDGCSDLNYETSYESMHTTGDAVLLDVYINRLLSLCEKEGINTTVSIPPMNKSSYNELNASYTEDLYYYFEALKSKYKNIKIESNIPVYDDKYFGDSSHLNREGALIFTEEFLSTY